jgi:hypothetical protein
MFDVISRSIDNPDKANVADGPLFPAESEELIVIEIRHLATEVLTIQ